MVGNGIPPLGFFAGGEAYVSFLKVMVINNEINENSSKSDEKAADKLVSVNVNLKKIRVKH